MTTPLKDITMLITGATRGLGRELALKGAAKGAHIIALGRTIGALEELDDEIKANHNKGATLIPLDLLATDRLDALGPALFPRHNKIDILISNAAYLGGLSPIAHTKTEEWEKIINTNLTANFALMRTLAPLLERADHAMALFITDNHEETRGKAYWGPYSASKAGLEALVKSFAGEYASKGITTALINPGPMPTTLRRKAFPGEDSMKTQPPAIMADTIINCLITRDLINGETRDLRA